MSKNIWIAASDGDLDRVKALIAEGISPNARDENTYTPLHAAASWNHEEVLRYLVSQGGQINVQDSDGETPLFVVESEDMAHVCIDLGADVKHRNRDGLSAAQHHAEDNPDLAAYLSSISGEPLPHPNASSDNEQDEEGDNEGSAEEGMLLDNDLLEKAQAVLAEAERTGANPDDALREVVQAAVSRRTGGEDASMAQQTAPSSDSKRRRDDVGR